MRIQLFSEICKFRYYNLSRYKIFFFYSKKNKFNLIVSVECFYNTITYNKINIDITET